MKKIYSLFLVTAMGTILLTSCIRGFPQSTTDTPVTESVMEVPSEDFSRNIEFTDVVEDTYFKDLKIETPEWTTVVKSETTCAILCYGINEESLTMTIQDVNPSGMQVDLNDYVAAIGIGSTIDGYKSLYESISFSDIQSMTVNGGIAYYVTGEINNSFAENKSFKSEIIIFESSESIYVIDTTISVNGYEKLYPYSQRIVESIQEASETESASSVSNIN